MRVLKDDEGNFIIYLLLNHKKYDMNHKDEIIQLVKNTVLKVNRMYHLNLKGFYKVRVYMNEKIGFVIEIIQIDDISIHNSIDLRVLVYANQDFYIEVDNFDFLPEHKKVIYYDDKYYINVNLLNKKEVISLLELGNLVYKSEVIDDFYFGKVIKN